MLTSHLHIMISMDHLRDPVGGRVFGSLAVTVVLDLAPFIPLTATVSCTLEEPRADEFERAWPVAPRHGLLGHCLSEVHYDDGCWRYIRQRLFAVPVVTTQTELAVAALSSPTFFGHANDAAFRAKFPVGDTARARRYGTCAVVGNAGHVLGSGLGREIDAHDVVLRFNEAPTEGFESDVGSRTTHRIVHYSDHIRSLISQLFAGSRHQSELLFLPLFHGDVDDFMHWRERASSDRVHLLSVSFIHYAWQLLGVRNTDKIPTSGFVGLVWALELCDKVDSYAMGFHRRTLDANDERCWSSADKQHCISPTRSRDPNRSSYAYFRRNDPRPWSYGHKWDVEDDLHLAWHRAGLLRRHFDLPPHDIWEAEEDL